MSTALLSPETFLAKPHEVLRVAGSVRPVNDRLHQVVAAQRQVARTACLLAEAQAAHERSLAWLQRARLACGFPESAGVVPAAGIVSRARSAGEASEVTKHYVGRVLGRERMTDLNKVVGSITLPSGDILAWKGSARYVDDHEDLFSGHPIVLSGFTREDGKIGLQYVRPATREEWVASITDPADAAHWSAEAVAAAGTTAQGIGLLKKRLADDIGSWTCQQCDSRLLSKAHASLAQFTTGDLQLVCRPCKEELRGAARVVPLRITSETVAALHLVDGAA